MSRPPSFGRPVMGFALPHVTIIFLVGLAIVAVLSAVIALIVSAVLSKRRPKKPIRPHLSEIETLADLRDRGVIEQAEFDTITGRIAKP